MPDLKNLSIKRMTFNTPEKIQDIFSDFIKYLFL